jgi:hypothetical protein
MKFAILNRSMMKDINLSREARNSTSGSTPGLDKS